MAHVSFIHGIGNKSDALSLERSWLGALRDGDGLDLRAEGVTTSVCYWADVLYAAPLPTVDAAEESDEELVSGAVETDPAWFADLPPEQQEYVRELAAEVGAVTGLEDAHSGAAETVEVGPRNNTVDVAAAPAEFERIPLPAPIKRRLMQTFLRDVHHYLWNTRYSPRPGQTFAVRDEVRRRLVAVLTAAADTSRPHVLVGHSLGSVIAYDVLRNVDDVPSVDALLTLGSPLGVDEVQDRLKPGWSRWDGFPTAALTTGQWVNVFDRLDPVCGLDPMIASDFRQGGGERIRDMEEPNWGRWRHAIDKYLRGPKLRASLAELLDVT